MTRSSPTPAQPASHQSVQGDLGHPPVAGLGDIERIRIAAVDGIDAAEILEALARLAELTHNRAVQLQFVDLPAMIQIVLGIGVGAEEILMRAGRDADRLRIAASGD